ncbi:MAG: hypothetical protein JWP51_984 [Bradyrhizobium sp.]|nr:hypothetical protein [Bradyrhizobium sp.]
MRRDYRLYELNEDEFESLVVKICARWFGPGVTPFAKGRDGGRDGRFHGTAANFPSARDSLQGHCVFQAKHVDAPNKSCSDRDFERLVKGEHKKIIALIKDAICDHYILFTNRKLSGGADSKLIKALLSIGLRTAHIVGTERLHMSLDEYADLRAGLPNRDDPAPFRFNPDDLVDVIGALHEYAGGEAVSAFNSAKDFDTIKIKTEKNKINGLSDAYYTQMLVNNSMPHFPRVEEFLKNPRNRDFAIQYHDAADELKQKILVHRAEFETFDKVFAFMYEEIQQKREVVKGKRRLVSILLHYMYFNCDIGSKTAIAGPVAPDAHA